MSSSEVFEFAPLRTAAVPVAPAPPLGASTSTQRAVDIVAQAEARAAQIEAAARQEGFAQGYAEGAAAARGELQPALQALASAAAEARGVREQLVSDLEREAVELALAVAEKIVGAAAASSPEAVLHVVTGALRRAAERDQLVVEVNPQDFELVRAAAGELADSLGGIGRLEVLSERRVQRGGCVVRTGDGEIDAQLDEQLRAVGDLFTRSRGDGS